VATGFSGQWSDRLLNYSQTAISYDQYIPKLHSGFGFGFTNINIPTFPNITYNTATIYYAFNFNINKNFQIRPAINAGFVRHMQHWIPYQLEGFCIPPNNTSSSSPNETPHYYPDFGAGLLIRYKKFITGVSYDHITEPENVIYLVSKLPSKLTIHGNYMFDLNGKVFLTPGIIYKKQKDFEEMDYSLLLKVWKIKCGFGFTQNFYNADYFTGLIGFCTKQLSIGYSYGLTISKLSNANDGPHEISAVFKFNCKNDKEKYRISQLDGF
jgi:type IX secretion system PorP/SprF family membrane protein